MENKSMKGVSCKLSQPRDKFHMMISTYTKGYPRSFQGKSQSDKKEGMWKINVQDSMYGIVLYDDGICYVLYEISC